MGAAFEADFTCAFCGLACDDVRVRVEGAALAVAANGCAISERALKSLSALDAEAMRARVNGAPGELSAALGAAADILRNASQPVLAGLATDLAGARAAMRLARRCGAVTDHMNFGAKMRDVLATQDRGWITTTFAEVKNRADMLLIVGTNVIDRFPRFFERLAGEQAMFAQGGAREFVLLGPATDMKQAASATQARVLDCPREALGTILGALRMFVAGHPAADRVAAQVGGVATQTLRELVARMKAAKYCVVVWSAADLDFAHAELTVQRIAELVKDLNATTRAAGLPLGGNDGDLTVQQVHVWQSGFTLRSDFGGAEPDYDPFLNNAARLLRRGEADALMWISSFSEMRLPPPADCPTIVLGRADMKLQREPEVFIPVGVPGVDHAGHFVRSDKVVTMRLGSLRESGMPSVAQVLAQIEGRLGSNRSP